MSGTPEATDTRTYGRSAGLLTAAIGVAGLLTYAYFALASHTLEPADYGDVVILWSLVFVVASTLFRPTEQLLARTLAERDQLESGTSDALRSAGKIQAGAVLVAVVAALIAKGPITDELFGGDGFLFWVLVASLAGFGAAFYARGLLAGFGLYSLYAALLVVEVGSRLIFVVVVALGIAGDVDLVAFGIATAPLAPLLVLPLVSRRRTSRVAPTTPASGGDEPVVAPEMTLARGGRFAGAVLLIMFSEQVLVNSGALLVRLADGPSAAGFVFNVLMIARAPMVLFQAVAASLLPHLTRLRTGGGERNRDQFATSMRLTLLLVAAFAAVTTIAVLAVGPQVMQLAFGDEFTYGRWELALVSVGTGFLLAAACLSQAVLAHAQASRAGICWGLAAVAFIAFVLLAPLDPVRAVEAGFTAAAALLAALLTVVYLRPHPNPADELVPGIDGERQAALLIADEIG